MLTLCLVMLCPLRAPDCLRTLEKKKNNSNWDTGSALQGLISTMPSNSISLTLNMLDCFKDFQGHICNLNRIFNLAWPKLMKLTLEEQYMLPVQHSQYHACWSFGDLKSQSIIRYDIHLLGRNIPSPASEELRKMADILILPHLLPSDQWTLQQFWFITLFSNSHEDKTNIA